LQAYLRSSDYEPAGHAEFVETLKQVSTEAVETMAFEILNAFLASNEVRMLIFTNESP
jgi:hypothetical protein